MLRRVGASLNIAASGGREREFFIFGGSKADS